MLQLSVYVLHLNVNVLHLCVIVGYMLPQFVCSVLQCVAVCCSVLQCVAVCCI